MAPHQTVEGSSGSGGPLETFESLRGQSQGPFGMSATVGPCSGASWGIHTAVLSISIAGLQGRFPRPDPQNTPRRQLSDPCPCSRSLHVYGLGHGVEARGPFTQQSSLELQDAA